MAWRGLARLGSAGQGRAGQGKAGEAWLGEAWLGGAGQGRRGGARHGWARLGRARHGAAWLGKAGQGRRGVARLGAARRGRAGTARQGVAGQGEARQGEARQGRRGIASQWFCCAKLLTRSPFCVTLLLTGGGWSLPDPRGAIMSKIKHGVERVAQALWDESGHVSPSALVAAAMDPSSPAHAGFEWGGGGKASNGFRLAQARAWLRKVTIIEDSRADRLVIGRALEQLRQRLAAAKFAVDQLLEAAEAAGCAADEIALIAQLSKAADTLKRMH